METKLGYYQHDDHHAEFECIRFELTHALIEHLMRGGQYNDYSPIYYKTLERIQRTSCLPKIYYPSTATIEVFDKRDNFENCMYLGIICQDTSVASNQIWTKVKVYVVTYNPDNFGKCPAFQVYYAHQGPSYGKTRVFDSYQLIGQF